MTENNQTKRVYISGLLPCASRRDYINRLHSAESQIYKLGYNTVNMANLELELGYGTGKTEDIHQNVSLAMLQCCDAIYMAAGWENSEMALEEKALATQYGLEVLFEPQTKEGA